MKILLMMGFFAAISTAMYELSKQPSKEANDQPAAGEKAVFGAGCFWGVEAAFAQLPGVVATRVGYAGGTTPHPSYEQVCSGTTGHTEVVEVTYDPKRISYAQLLAVFFAQHDPSIRQKTQYRSVIFYTNEAQHTAAVAAIDARSRTPRTLTALEPAGAFYQAEDYHQHYYQKHHITACPTGE